MPSLAPENKHGPHDMFRGRIFVSDAVAARDIALLGQFRIARILDLSGGPEYQTAEGEALRRDDDFAHAAVWAFSGYGQAPDLHKEPLTFDNVKLTTRSYK